jgi:putative immunoreactive 84 kDa antigen PG93
VRPDYDGSVTITGLIADSNVKITDLNGNLIRQGRSAGGQFTWDCRGANSQPVSSGVYLVLASTPDGSEGVVTKIAVVR